MGEPRTADDVLQDLWRQARDDERHWFAALSCVVFAQRTGLLTDEQTELWTRRLDTCPGHDDEGGRRWCAYCGDIPAVRP